MNLHACKTFIELMLDFSTKRLRSKIVVENYWSSEFTRLYPDCKSRHAQIQFDSWDVIKETQIPKLTCNETVAMRFQKNQDDQQW